MKLERHWAMPSLWTFQIPQVRLILMEEMAGVWADPFSGKYSPAQIRNDCNENEVAEFHLDGLAFLRQLEASSIDGVLFDPPYSVEQALRFYKPKHGGTAGRAEYWARCKDEIARVIRIGGKAISFGWDSTGIGKTRGFAIQRVVILCHGACHNDTIITIDIKL